MWGVSERSVRNYCALGRVPGAVLEGKAWLIPSGAEKPAREKRHSTKSLKNETVLARLLREKESGLKGSLYHRVQIDLTYNSNHIEGSRLTHDQTRYIFETKTLGITDSAVKVDDIVETVNHFRCVDLVIQNAGRKLTESFIKQLHFILKTGTSDSEKSWFRVGGYKMLENVVSDGVAGKTVQWTVLSESPSSYAATVGGTETAKPDEVASRMKMLLGEYNAKKSATFDDILDFHVQFEKIHPFQDGNGRIGRLLLFKECLKNDIVPFIITEELKLFYYRGIKEWASERGYLREFSSENSLNNRRLLTDTCLTAQDEFKAMMGSTPTGAENKSDF